MLYPQPIDELEELLARQRIDGIFDFFDCAHAQSVTEIDPQATSTPATTAMRGTNSEEELKELCGNTFELSQVDTGD